MCLTLVFSFHRQQLSAVMGELLYNIPCVDDDVDDNGYNSPLPTENWNTECDERAAFIDHRRMWAGTWYDSSTRASRESQRPSNLLDRRGQSLPAVRLTSSSEER